MNSRPLTNIAILDDYQNVALSMADWSALEHRASITVFNDHVAQADKLVDRLRPFNVVCVMRERTPLTRKIMQRLPELKLIASTGSAHASIDVDAAAELGIEVRHTGYVSTPTIEFTWALILALARNIALENRSVREGAGNDALATSCREKRSACWAWDGSARRFAPSVVHSA